MQLKWLPFFKKVLSACSLNFRLHWFLQLNYKALTKEFNKGNADSLEWRQLGMVPIVTGDLAEQVQSISTGSHWQVMIREELDQTSLQESFNLCSIFSEDRILKFLNLKRAPYLLEEAFKENWPPNHHAIISLSFYQVKANVEAIFMNVIKNSSWVSLSGSEFNYFFFKRVR